MAEMSRKRDNAVAAFPHWFRKLIPEMTLAVKWCRRRCRLRWVIVAASVAVSAGAQPEAAPEIQLEAAIHREIVMGDLPGAIRQYRALLSQPGLPRPVAARALLQTAECQQKLGQAKDAYNTFRRVANEYGDLADVAKPARLRLAAWSGPRNLKFEEGVPGKVPPGWFVPSLPKDADYLAGLRREGCHSKVGCAVVMVPVNVPRPEGNLYQNFSAAAYRGKTVRLRAWLKLDTFFTTPIGVRFADSEDRAQLWLRVERANGSIGFSDNMDDRPVRSTEWTQCEIVGTIDDDAQFIYFGVIVRGGRVWVDDVSFEVISQ